MSRSQGTWRPMQQAFAASLCRPPIPSPECLIDDDDHIYEIPLGMGLDYP